MPDETNPLPAPEASGASANPAPAPAAIPPTPFNIAEEFGTAGKNLPPVKMLAITLGAVAVVAIVFALIQRPTSAATGAIGDIASVEVPNQNLVMVAINVSIINHGEKPYWIHTMEATLETASEKFSDQPASAVDFDRYFQAFPDLKRHALPPLKLETKIEPGGQIGGTILVTFPVAPQAFAGRQSLTVKIQPYDQPMPLVLTR
jgi:hypothetical protein